MFGAAGAFGAAAGLPQTADADPIATTHTVGNHEVTAQWFNEGDESFVSVPDAQGTFSFNQEGVTPVQSGSEALKALSAQDSVRESGGGLSAILPIALLFCSAAAAGGAFYRWICRRKGRPKP